MNAALRATLPTDGGLPLVAGYLVAALLGMTTCGRPWGDSGRHLKTPVAGVRTGSRAPDGPGSSTNGGPAGSGISSTMP